MAKNKLIKGVMFSTDPNFQPEYENNDVETLPAAHQKLRVWLDTKNRGGKKATIVSGFEGKEEDLETLAKAIKTKLGVGGSAKESEIIIQGDYTAKVKEILGKMGYTNIK